MSQPTSVVEHRLPQELFTAATARVNEWRGRCLDAFTRVETLATECLAVMATGDRGRSIALPHLVGQRLDALSVAIAATGPFALEAGTAATELEAFRRRLPVRNMLCHGTGKVTLDLQGRWTVVLRVTSLRSRAVVREQLALTEVEAGELADELVRASRQLCSQLGQLRHRLR